MEQPSSVAPQQAPLKLNMKRTFIIGFAFFGILLMWQVYDNYCSSFLSELFIEAFGLKWTTPDEHKAVAEQVQWLVGIMMAIDNIAALVMMPLFGRLSDKTKSPLGKRMPYILVGTFICAVAFPFIPLAFQHHILGVLPVVQEGVEIGRELIRKAQHQLIARRLITGQKVPVKIII